MQLVKNIKAIQHTHKSHKTLLSLFFMALKCICCMFCISLLLLVFRCVHFFFVSSFIRIWAAQKCEYHLYACSSLSAINYTSAAVFMVPFGSFTQERKKNLIKFSSFAYFALKNGRLPIGRWSIDIVYIVSKSN